MPESALTATTAVPASALGEKIFREGRNHVDIIKKSLE